MAVPSDTSHQAQEVIPLYGGGALGENLGSVCRQDSQTLKSRMYIRDQNCVFKYTNFAEDN